MVENPCFAAISMAAKGSIVTLNFRFVDCIDFKENIKMPFVQLLRGVKFLKLSAWLAFAGGMPLKNQKNLLI
jgi:hypothetical protein